MIRLLQLLFYGHIHKWKIIKTHELTMTGSKSTGTRHELQCEKCGNVKMVDLI